jgi:hypothetical protein
VGSGSLTRLNRVVVSFTPQCDALENLGPEFVRLRRSVIMTRPNSGFSFVARIYVEPCFDKQGRRPSPWDLCNGVNPRATNYPPE